MKENLPQKTAIITQLVKEGEPIILKTKMSSFLMTILVIHMQQDIDLSAPNFTPDPAFQHKAWIYQTSEFKHQFLPLYTNWYFLPIIISIIFPGYAS